MYSAMRLLDFGEQTALLRRRAPLGHLCGQRSDSERGRPAAATPDRSRSTSAENPTLVRPDYVWGRDATGSTLFAPGRVSSPSWMCVRVCRALDCHHIAYAATRPQLRCAWLFCNGRSRELLIVHSARRIAVYPARLTTASSPRRANRFHETQKTLR